MGGGRGRLGWGAGGRGFPAEHIKWCEKAVEKKKSLDKGKVCINYFVRASGTKQECTRSPEPKLTLSLSQPVKFAG